MIQDTNNVFDLAVKWTQRCYGGDLTQHGVTTCYYMGKDLLLLQVKLTAVRQLTSGNATINLH